MKFCDTHIHVLAPEWQGCPQQRIEKAAECGIDLLLQPGVRSADWADLLELTGEASSVYAAPGLHPVCAAEWTAVVAERLRELCQTSKVVAIGEIGLDALLDVDQQVQQRAFRGQLAIALEFDLPVLIHCRKKTAEVLGIIREARAEKAGGIWHGFSGSLETAQQIIDCGFLIGIGPVLLRENARKLPATLKALPADKLVLETDAPDMAAGPEVLLGVATALGVLRGWTLAETARITTANARRILKLQD